MPLTLARLESAHRYAVIEMGANHPGEIAHLAGIAAPGVGLVINAGPAHLEGFGGLDGVARAKGELFESLGGDGTAVINADDRYADLWRGLARGAGRQITFGMREPADFRATLADVAAGCRIGSSPSSSSNARSARDRSCSTWPASTT